MECTVILDVLTGQGVYSGLHIHLKIKGSSSVLCLTVLGFSTFYLEPFLKGLYTVGLYTIKHL